MSNSKPISIIQIKDDQGEKPRPPKPEPIFNTVTPFNFPKLHAILQRHHEEKAKSQEAPKKQSQSIQIKPIEASNNNEIEEVSNIVYINKPSQNLEMANENHQTPKINEEIDLLIVQEQLQPMIKLPKESNQVFYENRPITENEIQPQFSEDSSKIKSSLIQNQVVELQNNQRQILAYSIQQDQTRKISLPTIQVMVHQQHHKMIEPANQIISQIKNNVEQQNEPNEINNNPTTIINDSVYQNREVISLDDQNIQPANQPNEAQPQEKYNIELIKSQILQILPEWSQSIRNLTKQEVIQIYKAIKPQIQENQIGLALDPPLPIRSAQQNSHQMQIEANDQVSIISSSKDNNKELDKGDNNKVVQQNNIVQVHPFYALKNCNQKQLREGMIKFFPQAKESLINMTYEDLKMILDKGLSEVQLQSKQISTNNIQQNNTTIQINNDNQIRQVSESLTTIADIRNYLYNKLSDPQLQQKLQQLSDATIKKIYEGINFINLSKDQFSKRVDQFLKKQQKKNLLLKLCYEHFPDMVNQIAAISEQDITKIYESLLIESRKTLKKSQPQPQKRMQKTGNSQVPTNNQRINSFSPQPVLKRNYEAMISSNPKKHDQSSLEKKGKRLSSNELRAKLIAKLPNLKDNIMKLDDKQIEKIYKESLQIGAPRNKRSNGLEEEIKPSIFIHQKKFINKDSIDQKVNNTLSKSQTQGIRSNKTEILFNNGGQTQVISLQDKKRSKTRTLVFMHTEEISDDQSQYNKKNSSKISDSNENMTVSDILRKLAEMFEKRS